MTTNNPFGVFDDEAVGPAALCPYSIKLLPRHMAILGNTGPNAKLLSANVANIIERQALILCDALPNFTNAEWLFLCDVFRGQLYSTHHIMFMESEVLEAGYSAGVARGVDRVDLAQQINLFSVAERVAIAEFLDRYWSWPEFHKDACCSNEVIERIKDSFKYTAELGDSIYSNRSSEIGLY